MDEADIDGVQMYEANRDINEAREAWMKRILTMDEACMDKERSKRSNMATDDVHVGEERSKR